jgi:hypothetical protein
MDSDGCTEAVLGEIDLLLFAIVCAFLESFIVVVDEEEEFPCEGAGGCCEDRARDDLRGDMVERCRTHSVGSDEVRLRVRKGG